MAALMRRAVQQAKAEAAAQQFAADGHSISDAQDAPGPDINGAKAARDSLQKAGKQMQNEEQPAQASMAMLPADDEDAAAVKASAEQAMLQEQPRSSSADMHATTSDDDPDPDNMPPSTLIFSSSSSSDLDAISSEPTMQPRGRQPSLGDQLLSMLKSAQTALSPSRQSSYIPIGSDEDPEAEGPDADAREVLPGKSRRALPWEASLGQRIGSLLTGALSLPRQSSSMAMPEEPDEEAVVSSGQPAPRALPRELSLRERYGSPSLPRQTSRLPESQVSNSAQRTASQELRFAERYGSPARQPSYTFPSAQPALFLSPSSRTALPRDASYLPEWVHRSLGRSSTLRGDGSSSPRSRLAPTFSAASSASQEEDSVPKWVDWPHPGTEEPWPAAQQAEAEEELDPPVPQLLAPPHVRRANQEATKPSLPLPRAKRPSAFAANPLSLSLVHTPSMNPSLDLMPAQTAVPTPKGQRLFDFWHQKAEAVPAAAEVAPHNQAIVIKPSSQAALGGGSPNQNAPNQRPFTTGLWRQAAAIDISPDGSATRQSRTAQAASTNLLAPAAESAVGHESPTLGHIHLSTESATSSPRAQHGSLQLQEPGLPHTDLVAELAMTSQLVQQQSLQQAELLAGLESALAQLSEHRLLILNPLPPTERSPDTALGKLAVDVQATLSCTSC